MRMTMLRVLCLHDKHSNAFLYSSSWRPLEERLRDRHGIELVYFNGPIFLRGKGKPPVDEEEATSPFSTDEQTHSVDSPSKMANEFCAWWNESEETAQTGLVLTDAGSIRSVTGLDASLMLLRQIWVSSPFVGIIGVGQGASMASLLTASVLQPHPQFLVLVNGVSLFPDEEQLSTIPTLHLVDSIAENLHGRTKLLIQQFPGAVIQRSGRKQDDFNAIGRFIIDQINALQSSDSLQQVSLQTALYEAECQAEEAIARHIETNPPSSLMAVIRPDNVALPSHRHQVPLQGAPCPSEFLVPREERRKTSLDAADSDE